MLPFDRPLTVCVHDILFPLIDHYTLASGDSTLKIFSWESCDTHSTVNIKLSFYVLRVVIAACTCVRIMLIIPHLHFIYSTLAWNLYSSIPTNKYIS